ncbi:hypothetical protein D3C85_1205880 [compost metagenome]
MKMHATPHTRFCKANAMENTSRPQPCARPIGCMNRPKVARTPMASSTTRVPKAMVRAEIVSVWLDMKSVSRCFWLCAPSRGGPALRQDLDIIYKSGTGLGNTPVGECASGEHRCARRPFDLGLAPAADRLASCSETRAGGDKLWLARFAALSRPYLKTQRKPAPRGRSCHLLHTSRRS